MIADLTDLLIYFQGRAQSSRDLAITGADPGDWLDAAAYQDAANRLAAILDRWAAI